MFRALRSMVYNAVMGGIHDALKDSGIVDEGATGTPAEQVRAAIADKADENKTPTTTARTRSPKS